MSRLLKYMLLFFLGYQLIQILFIRKKSAPPAHRHPPFPQHPSIKEDGDEGEFIEYEEVKE